MMARDIQEPVETPGDFHDKKLNHPAFGQIRASRVSGDVALYDSDFVHHHYVTITLSRSELHRGLSNDWHHGREELFEVALSEAQWASFVSSMNVGSGVPCTIQRNVAHPGYMVPGLPAPKAPAEKFKGEIKQAVAELQRDLRALAGEVDGALSKTRAADIQRRMGWIADRLTDNTGFVADQFDRHVEKTVERAKTEINAYAVATVQRAGLDAIQDKRAAMLEYRTDTSVNTTCTHEGYDFAKHGRACH